MTPKEKAEELYKKMYTQHPNTYPSTAKQCATIAVDEVLNFINTDAFSYTNEKYWQEVKNELNKQDK